MEYEYTDEKIIVGFKELSARVGKKHDMASAAQMEATDAQTYLDAYCDRYDDVLSRYVPDYISMKG